MPKFRIDDANKEDILKIVTYHPHNYVKAVISLTQPTGDVEFKPPTSSIGSLKVLPIELFDLVIKYSDMHTVSVLRTANRRTRLIVDASFPYKHIILCAPHIRATLERTGVASHFFVEEVFCVLSNPACHVCGNFGLYLWIPECIRCCITCLKEDPGLMPMSERDAQAAFGLTKSQMAMIPVMVTLPGEYTTFQKSRQRGVRLLSQKRARQLGIVVRGKEGLDKYTSSSNSKSLAAYRQKLAKRDVLDFIDKLQYSFDDVYRYLSAVHFPYFDRLSHTTHVGLACRGCDIASRGSTTSQHRRNKTYTTAGALEHVKGCPDAQDLWMAN
ncbi:hypothetical protein CPB84DRAFT_1805566 [Gymnopilus junonius]|uniref:F-box domain-containing protein n=1 Tax=Gymnopilus junonius TaxID=109634 RepID=A0A9P5TFD7_GYMJU|nr:hypothetical protein CPB84DRAFT_1805566 [Gymnopilus junonius]